MSEHIFTDGQWKQLTKTAYNSLPVGTSFTFRGKQAPYGSLVEDGSILNIATYPQLFAVIGTLYGGDGVTTFALPNSIGRYNRGGLSEEVGSVVEAGLPNITGETGGPSPDYGFMADNSSFGAFKNGSRKSYMVNGALQSSYRIAFDASLSNSIYGNSDTVTPPSVVGLPCIKAFDTVADEVQINLAAELEALKAKYEAERMVSTIIYPNGGTAESPANVTTNQRYEMDNPFPGYFVQCEAQIQLDGKWGKTGFVFAANTQHGYGTNAGQLLQEDKIVVQTGSGAVATFSIHSGGIVLLNADPVTTAPCRVIVTRLGKMPD